MRGSEGSGFFWRTVSKTGRISVSNRSIEARKLVRWCDKEGRPISNKKTCYTPKTVGSSFLTSLLFFSSKMPILLSLDVRHCEISPFYVIMSISVVTFQDLFRHLHSYEGGTFTNYMKNNFNFLYDNICFFMPTF